MVRMPKMSLHLLIGSVFILLTPVGVIGCISDPCPPRAENILVRKGDQTQPAMAFLSSFYSRFH